jgi:hypothetical protein
MVAAPPPPPAVVQHVAVGGRSLTFTFDRRPQHVTARFVTRAKLHDCASDHVVRLRGTAFVVVHFIPAQSARRMGPYLRTGGPVTGAAKVCDFESDVGWAIGLTRRLRVHVSRAGSTVTVTFDG